MSISNGNHQLKIDYERIVVVLRDGPDLPWCTHKAFALDGKDHALAEAKELRKRKKRGLIVKVVRIGILEVVE